MPILTTADVKSYLGIVGSDDDAKLATLVLAVEQAAARYCGRSAFASAWYAKNERLAPGRAAMVLPVRPVVGRPLVTFGDLGFIFTPADVDASADTITCEDHRFSTGDGPLRVYTTGTLPAGLAATTNYWAIYVDDNTVKLALSEANALAGTDVDVTDTGTGTFRLVGPFEPSGAIDCDPDSGVLTLAGGIPLPSPARVVVLWQSAVDEPALVTALAKQAAYEWLNWGKGGRLGDMGTETPGGVRSSYAVQEWAPGVLATLDTFRLRGLG